MGTIKTVIDLDPKLQRTDEEVWRAMSALAAAAKEGRMHEIEFVNASTSRMSDGLANDLHIIKTQSGQATQGTMTDYKNNLTGVGNGAFRISFAQELQPSCGGGGLGQLIQRDDALDCSKYSGDDKKRCEEMNQAGNQAKKQNAATIDQTTKAGFGAYMKHKNEGSDVFSQIMDFLKSQIFDNITKFVGEVANWLMQNVEKIVKWLEGIGEAIGSFFGGIIGDIGAAFGL